MENTIWTTVNWGGFLLTAFILAFIYLVLFVTQELTKHSSFSGRFKNRFKNLFRQIFVVFELLVAVILAGVFILINPILHGIIVLFLLLGSIPYIKSYISGRWIHFDRSITEGVELKIGKLQGVVTGMKRTKMYLQTSEGLQHLSYSRLLADGYTLLSGEEIGGFYHLELSPGETAKGIKNHRLHLLDLFATAPYVDWHHKPDLFQDDDDPNTVDARVLIKEESHLHELIALIKEWGYQGKMIKT